MWWKNEKWERGWSDKKKKKLFCVNLCKTYPPFIFLLWVKKLESDPGIGENMTTLGKFEFLGKNKGHEFIVFLLYSWENMQDTWYKK